MPSSHLILCCPLLLLPPIPPSIRVFSNESTLRMKWPKYWSLSFSIIPSKEIPGLISFRMDWLDLLAVQGTLKSLLQHHSSKASIRSYWIWIMQIGLKKKKKTTRSGKNETLYLMTLRHYCSFGVWQLYCDYIFKKSVRFGNTYQNYTSDGK